MQFSIMTFRDEIEEFGIEHPEVRREDLEFIEVGGIMEKDKGF